MGADLKNLRSAALAELGAALQALEPSAAEPLMAALLRARRVALYGAGREGLMMKAFAMRLFHLGLEVHVVGDMTLPPIGDGDLLVLSAGPGGSPVVLALLETAKRSGARTFVVTAEPQGAAAKAADAFLWLPAQTMASDQHPGASVLPMGSLFEAVQLLFFDLLALMLRERLGRSAEAMRARHTNLE